MTKIDLGVVPWCFVTTEVPRKLGEGRPGVWIKTARGRNLKEALRRLGETLKADGYTGRLRVVA